MSTTSSFTETALKSTETAFKLERLRASLVQNAAHAVLIPVSDAFQNEFRSPADERLAWISGFDGSAGFGIITLTHAAIFVDGRYTLQVTQQVDTTLFEGLPQEKLTNWVQTHLLANQTILYDPWLFSISDVELWKKRADTCGFTLTPMTHNLIDPLWEDRPAFEAKPFFLHPLPYSGMTPTDKMQTVLAEMSRKGIAHYLFANSESLNWLLNVRGHDLPNTPIHNMYGLLQQDGTLHIFTRLNREANTGLNGSPSSAYQETFGDTVHFHSLDTCSDFFENLAPNGQLGLDPKCTPFALYLLVANHPLLFTADLCLPLRAVKNAIEQNGARQAHIRDGVALVTFLHWLDENSSSTTEMDLADTLEACRAQQALFHSLSFPTIAGFKANGAIVHYRSTEQTNQAIQGDGLLLIDSGAQYYDGTTDVTRTVAIGTPTTEQCDSFSRVLKGHINIASAIFPKGTAGEQLDPLARHALWQVGLDYDHGTGHGVGSFLNVHEGPHRISKAGPHTALQPGMIVSNEPGYYKTGEYGIRIESLLLVQAHNWPDNTSKRPSYCFETLTLAPIDLKLTLIELLSAHEIAWLDAYHQRVYDTLSPHLPEAVRQWLYKTTRPCNPSY